MATGGTSLAGSVLNGGDLGNGSVSRAKIATSAIDSTRLAANAVITAKLAKAAVSSSKLAQGAVTKQALAPGSVTGTALGAGAAHREQACAGRGLLESRTGPEFDRGSARVDARLRDLGDHVHRGGQPRRPARVAPPPSPAAS